MTSTILTPLVITIAVLLLKFGQISIESDELNAVNQHGDMLFSPSLATDRVPSLAAHSSIHLLIKRSNQCMTLSNTNSRRVSRKQSTTMLLLIILLGGDVQMNPGPGPNKHPCGICERPVAKNHRGLECDECGHWVHIKCGDVTSKTMNSSCVKINLPGYAHAVLFPTLATASLMRVI